MKPPAPVTPHSLRGLPPSTQTPQQVRGDKSRPYLTCLQTGRALAALLVICYHNGQYIFALPKYWGFDPTRAFFNFGHAGVEFFFVLSGFIILHVHWDDLGRPARLANYASKRFLRIYPLYWLVLLTVIPVYFIVPSFGFPYHRKLSTILSSIALIYVDNDQRCELATAWTLYHEVFFYAVFTIAIARRRAGIAVLSLWMLVCAAALMLPPLPYPLRFILSPFQLLFGFGMLACASLRRGAIPAPRLLALIGAALFIAAGMEENYLRLLDETTRNLIFGAASALIIAAMVELERQGRLRAPAWARLTGDASYSIYLIHFTLLSLLAKVFISTSLSALPPIIAYALTALLAALGGIALHLVVEKPLLNFLSRKQRA